MGMAAGQARLLSITSRMSDNELRAQIINNNKMRLAAESSQASETYVAALNEAQLMFTNYDAENNTTYQSLTYNALTAFNPYNNQYALINSSGNVLLSEKDAENYRASGGNLDAFLSKYGLDYTTTYFEQFGETVKFECYGNMEVSTKALEKLYSATAVNGDAVELGNVGTINLYNADKSSAVTYLGTANSETMYNYDKYLQLYYEKKDKYLAFINDAMKEEFKNLLENAGIKNENDTPLKTLSDIKSFLDSVINFDDDGGTITNPVELSDMNDNVYTPLINLIKNMKDSKYTNNNIAALDGLLNILNDNSGEYVKDEYTSEDYRYVTDGTDLFVVDSKYKSNGVYDETTGERKGQSYVMQKITSNGNIYNIDDEGKYSDSIFSGTPKVSTGDCEGWDHNPYVDPSIYDTTDPNSIESNGKKYYQVQELDSIDPVTGEKTYKNKEVAFTAFIKNDVENMATVAKSVLTSLNNSISSYWDVDAPAWTTNIQNTNLLAAYNAYKDAAKNLSLIIFGTDCESKYDDLGDIYKLYEDYSSGPAFTEDFKKVFLNLVMDELLDTYGEPKYTWIDKSQPTESYNTNGEAKAAWYENLFNRIKSGGYAVLQDGLASSSEWIQFAFESGMVTMEQVDSFQSWNPLIYSNCSDITSQTNEKMIAKAEAEYRNAMNKIENKDKRYDLELKNIDTEHNSLMTEYESIKSAIDKNIERTFKLYS